MPTAAWIGRAVVQAGLFGVVAASSSTAQSRVSPGVAVQFVSHGGPLGGQSGFGAVLSVALISSQWFGATVAFDVARLKHGDRISLCIPLPDGQCLDRPETETIAGLGVSFDAEPATGGVRPFVSVGPALRVADGPEQAGERQLWFTPHVEAGARLAAGGAQWSLSIRWRRVDRWESVKPFSELTLVLGARRDGP